MADDDFEAAEQAERLGDAAETRQAAAAHYREAQRVLLPVGVVWTDREAYDRRREAFERIQQKLYELEERDYVAPPAAMPAALPEAEIATVAVPVPMAAPDLPVWNFTPGLVVRIARTFSDFDGQEIRAGEVLHFLARTYFPYDGGHTLYFAEKVIRLADIADENVPVIANAGNAWFEPVG